MEEMQKQLFDALLTEAGLVSAFLFFSNLVWIAMYITERKDRKSAWESNVAFKQQVIEAMKEIVPILEVIKDRTRRD